MSDAIDCAYCGCDVTAHDPVYVREADEGVETPYCNYGCLGARIKEDGLATGTTCSIEI
ncbi:hypothetical protein Hbl1158_01460 [Halobaculum sp. CBA1158]|uniref:hypothetical protein n=1 Tax=Halobaculum sp. CBA1158 TaxID=2904243 RepID=UPI001F1E7F61|nr:hypothetical protein [Halobaculum sp. CBA1158]UIP00067.1 hypothetical protein Hbl1158_01460 [Halobaculum sp. CBA1158]